MIKELMNYKHYRLGILNLKNYYIYDERKDKIKKDGKIQHKYKYYQYLNNAVSSMIKLITDEKSKGDLNDWLLTYKKESDKIISIYGSAMSVAKLEKELTKRD